MNPKSIGQLTNLFLAKTTGHVYETLDSLIIKTPSNKDFHWGNYMLFSNPPLTGDLERWTKLFDEEFDYYLEPHHYAFTWDNEFPKDSKEFIESEAEIKKFTDAQFDLELTVALSTQQLVKPKHFNSHIQVVPLSTKAQWQNVIDLQIESRDLRFGKEDYAVFKREQFKNYIKMHESQLGHWFGAYLDGELVGDLGIFFENGIARYQSVETKKEFERQGICATLVYTAGKYMMEQYNVHTLVMEADEHYHAARIYESVGFQKSSFTRQLSWWKNKPLKK
jgi:hypothetical protein